MNMNERENSIPQSETVLNEASEIKDIEKTELKPPKKKKKKKRKGKDKAARIAIFIGVILIVSLLISAGALVGMNEVLGLNKPDNEVTVEIPYGSNTADIAQTLKEHEIIKYPFLFRFYSKFKEADGTYMYGAYVLNSSMGYDQIINELQKVSVRRDVVSVTIPEGYTMVQIAKLLQEKKVVQSAKDFINDVNSKNFGYDFEKQITPNKLKYYRMEGFLYPDTYEFYENSSTEFIISKFYDNFKEKVTTDLYQRMKEMGMTLEQTVTLASIIEMESSDKAFMNDVSAVFYNRLKRPDLFPKLESDATNKYINETLKRNMIYEDEEVLLAYDSYQTAGMPVGPICNPSVNAIQAALYPERSSYYNEGYYYFCSNVKTREFFFAKTLAQHNANLRKAGLR